MILVERVENPQTVSRMLAFGPDYPNVLFTFSGVAVLDWQVGDDDLHADMAELDLSFWHGGVSPRSIRPFCPQSTEVAALAWPSSMHADDGASEVTWAVDRVSPDLTAQGRLRLNLALALQGKKSALSRVAYHAFVRTIHVPLIGFSIVPNEVVGSSGQRVPVTIELGLEQAAPVGGQPIMIASDAGGLQLPTTAMVPAGSSGVTIMGAVELLDFPAGESRVTVTATTALSQIQATMFVSR